jgi:hypothetical protein
MIWFERADDESRPKFNRKLLRELDSAARAARRHVERPGKGLLEQTYVFRSGNLVQGAGDDTPRLHLHGAVGWYERNGEIVLEDAEERPGNGSRGFESHPLR